jgi:anti-sigma factor ChrR (cupin superfamily)
MSHEQTTQLAALNAVGALDSDESATFAALLATANPKTKAGVARFLDAAALVAVSKSPAWKPSASLKGKIMALIDAAPSSSAAQSLSKFYFIGRDEGEWKSLPVPGVRVKELAVDGRRGFSMKLYELAPGARLPQHHHFGPEGCFVLSGDCCLEGRDFHGGDFHYAETDSDHGESFSENGCLLLVMAASDGDKH